MKGHQLEECVFWLLDGMGAKDIEWRVGGKGGGAADGGRDLEARLFTSGDNGIMEPRRWWVECKGRTGTLEKEAVTVACNNAVANPEVDVLVIATNTTFSNPTRDWVKTWQQRFPKPEIYLWDRRSLEQLLGRQPATVLRLFEKGLSSAGYMEAVRERFWNLLEYSSIERLKRIWKERDNLQIGPMERVALIANEFAHGNIDERPWAGGSDSEAAVQAFHYAMLNVIYLFFRVTKYGATQEPVIQTLAYVTLAALRHIDADVVVHVMKVALQTEEESTLKPELVEHLLMPFLDALRGDLQAVCTADCPRFSRDSSLQALGVSDPLDTYWARFSSKGARQASNVDYSRLQNLREPCIVGFDLRDEAGCPLYEVVYQNDDFQSFLEIAEYVIRRRARVVGRGRRK
nr:MULTISPECIES: restriction endonuclease [unclassified Rhizobium]